MSTKKEIANELLQKWEPWEKIVNKAGDGSGTYEELRLFLASNAKQTYEDLRNQNIQLNQLKSDVNNTKSRLTKLVDEKGLLEKKIEERKKEQIQLVTKNDELVKRNQILEYNIKELQEKGADDMVINKIREFDHKDKAELLERVKSVIKYTELLEEKTAQQQAINNLINENEKSRKELIGRRDKIAELNNGIKKLENDLEKVGKTAEISEVAVTYGYSPKALEALLKTIENYLELTPYKTNTRVFEALQEYQSLQQLREATTMATRENEVIRTQLLQSKGELNAIRDTVIKIILEAADNSSDIIEANKKDAVDKLQNLQEQQGKILASSEEKLESLWDDLEAKNQAWETKLREIGRYELLLKNSLVLATAYYNPDSAKDITTSDIAILSQVVDNWVQYYLKGAIATTPRDLSNIQGFNNYTSYSIPGLSRFLSQQLRERAES